ncbi:hypothetical protein ACROYT_G014840 [Oculina patagonica]
MERNSEQWQINDDDDDDDDDDEGIIVYNNCKVSFNGWLWGLETYENRSKKARRFPTQVHEEDSKNKVAPDHILPTNPGEYKSEQNER